MTRDLFQEAKLDPVGMERAREVAQWEIGDPAWADVIVRAYFLPTPEWQEAHKGIHGEVGIFNNTDTGRERMKNDVRQVIPALRAAGYKVEVDYKRLTTIAVEHMPRRVRDQVAVIPAHSAPLHVLRTANLDVSPTGGTTTVSVETPDGLLVASGSAICSIKDAFVRRVGLTKACGRVVSQLQEAGIYAGGEIR